jgi:hypothetical protein
MPFLPKLSWRGWFFYLFAAVFTCGRRLTGFGIFSTPPSGVPLPLLTAVPFNFVKSAIEY